MFCKANYIIVSYWRPCITSFVKHIFILSSHWCIFERSVWHEYSVLRTMQFHIHYPLTINKFSPWNSWVGVKQQPLTHSYTLSIKIIHWYHPSFNVKTLVNKCVFSCHFRFLSLHCYKIKIARLIRFFKWRTAIHLCKNNLQIPKG